MYKVRNRDGKSFYAKTVIKDDGKENKHLEIE